MPNGRGEQSGAFYDIKELLARRDVEHANNQARIERTLDRIESSLAGKAEAMAVADLREDFGVLRDRVKDIEEALSVLAGRAKERRWIIGLALSFVAVFAALVTLLLNHASI